MGKIDLDSPGFPTWDLVLTTQAPRTGKAVSELGSRMKLAISSEDGPARVIIQVST